MNAARSTRVGPEAVAARLRGSFEVAVAIAICSK